jgi:hypothetical protein
MDTTIYLLELCIFGIATAGFITLFAVSRVNRRVRRLEASDI